MSDERSAADEVEAIFEATDMVAELEIAGAITREEAAEWIRSFASEPPP